jgi:hypothetical protein
VCRPSITSKPPSIDPSLLSIPTQPSLPPADQIEVIIRRLKRGQGSRIPQGKWGRYGARLLPLSPAWRYGGTLISLSRRHVLPIRPLLKDIPENNARKSRRALAHAAITIASIKGTYFCWCMKASISLRALFLI